MDKVKEMMDNGQLTASDLQSLLTCKDCNCDAPVFVQQTTDQRSDGWLQARSGRVTASDCAAVCVSSIMIVISDCLCILISVLTGVVCGCILVGGIAV